MAPGSRRVIAGVSGSLRSLGALRAGVAEARAAGVPLLAVLAWAPVGGEVAYRRGPCPLLLRLWEQAACERLRDAFDDAFGGMPGGVAVRQLVVRAAPGPALVELADRPDDLLVVGYGGRSRLGYAVHGAITRYCIAHARCPVLTAPPPELIKELRPRRHHWRPEDFAAPWPDESSASFKFVPPEPTSETRKKNITLNDARGRCRPRCARSGAPRPGARSALGAWQAAVPGERIYPAGTGSP